MTLYMNKRQIKIFKSLMYSNEPVSSDILSNQCGASSKTIRSDISLIKTILEEKGATVKSKPGLGYELEVLDKNKFIKFQDDISNKKKEICFI